MKYGPCSTCIAILFEKYGYKKEAFSCFETALRYKKIALGEDHQSVSGSLSLYRSFVIKMMFKALLT